MAALAEGGQDHGALVQQILETQKELEDVNKRQQHKGAVEIVSTTMCVKDRGLHSQKY